MINGAFCDRLQVHVAAASPPSASGNYRFKILCKRKTNTRGLQDKTHRAKHKTPIDILCSFISLFHLRHGYKMV